MPARHVSAISLSYHHAGDLAKPNLGLKAAVYQELAQSLDTVVHNGALVNHAYTYEQLFEPNVLGSLEVNLPRSLCGTCLQSVGLGTRQAAVCFLRDGIECLRTLCWALRCLRSRHDEVASRVVPSAAGHEAGSAAQAQGADLY